MSTYGSGRGNEVTITKASKTAQVKNRAPAPIQISSEQLLREARDRKIELEPRAPRQQITDKEELQEYRMRKRKEFEDAIRMQRNHLGNYTKYAAWEEEQQEFARARSVFERGVDVDYRDQSLWLKYTEMEMRNKFVNHARNLYDRATALLPRVDQFWYKYTYMEEMLGNFKLARQVFQRWMKWEPDENAFSAFAKFEMRRGDESAARAVYEQYVEVHPTLRAFLKFAKWEEKQLQVARCRGVYERALVELPDETERSSEKLFLSFAAFEERATEHDRARVIYKYALDELGREQMPELYRCYIAFEKKFGCKDGIEDAIVGKRRLQYEEALAAAPHDYDTWFDYARLEEEGAAANSERVREVYERAVAMVPPVSTEKRFWRRYVYLWINYALFEELVAEDVGRAREVYRALLATIPHQHFSFAKAFTLAAMLEVRQRDLAGARRLLGQGLGYTSKLGKEKVFKDYIHLERQLGEVDRCRSIFHKYVEALPTNCGAWIKFADLEASLGEDARARAVFEVAVAQQALDMPEVLWKRYIEFEIEVAKVEREEQGDVDDEDGARGQKVRELYERLLDRTQHVKVWASYAAFEASKDVPDGTGSVGVGGGLTAARAIYRRAYEALKASGEKEDRVVLLEGWRDLEKRAPRKLQALQEVTSMMPKKVKKRRAIAGGGTGGEDEGWEEYYDYHFPDDRDAPVNLKLLEMARLWKTTGQIPAAPTPAAAPALTEEEEGAVSATGDRGEAEEGNPAAKKARTDAAEIDLEDE